VVSVIGTATQPVLYDIVLIVIGFGLLANGGDLFVDSSIQIGKALRVPRFVIGGTLVSLATTAPELVVSTMASSIGDSGIALGNAVGSCICNIGLIVGTVALLVPVEVERRDFVRRSAWMVAAAVLLVVFTWDRTLSRPLAALLLALSFAYLTWDYLGIRQQRAEVFDWESTDTSELIKSVALFGLGAVLIVVGSRLLVVSGQSLATAIGVPSIIIGLSVVAVGTSLPELVTGVSAARKGVPDLSLGNIIGANVLNLVPDRGAVRHDQSAHARPLHPGLLLRLADRVLCCPYRDGRPRRRVSPPRRAASSRTLRSVYGGARRGAVVRRPAVALSGLLV